MTNTTTARGPQEEVSAAMMRFVRQLAADVSGPQLELPSYPEVALRVQRVLGDLNAGNERIVKVISSEPILASRIINLANSAALNRSGKPVLELRSAVARVGFDTLRTAAISFAVTQLRMAAEYRSIQKPMTILWQQSVHLAAVGFVLARHLKRFAPDMVMLAGLVSGVGKLYILTRSSQYPAVFADPESYPVIVKQWHAQVARSILDHWKLAPEIVDAVAEIEEASADDRAQVTMGDLLAVTQLLTDLKDAPDLLAVELPNNRAAMRLGITAENCVQLLVDSTAEVNSLREALGR